MFDHGSRKTPFSAMMADLGAQQNLRKRKLTRCFFFFPKHPPDGKRSPKKIKTKAVFLLIF
jgi:hypothetical protein